MPIRIGLFALSVAFVLAGCAYDDGDFIGAGYDCPSTCDDNYTPVERCPAFSDCRDMPYCDDYVCAPVEDVQNNQHNNYTRPPADCDSPVECPTGSLEVDECPDDALCTTISLCDETLICKEQPQYCDEQPLCPDDKRPVKDCTGLADEYCSTHHHCSGPVTCLECHDELPDACPDDTTEVDEADCDNPGQTCQSVETCQSTLYCATSCIEEPQCPQETTVVDECSDEGPDCLTIDGCQDTSYCQAPDESCEEMPICPDDYQFVDVAQCLDNFADCVFEIDCGNIATCLPEP